MKQPSVNGSRKARYCRDCKHMGDVTIEDPICERPRFHMVTGEPMTQIAPRAIQPQKAFTCRVTFTDCGPWAMFWEPKSE